jgi:hypothetical protein
VAKVAGSKKMPGGGSKPGERRGGRKKGTPNKTSQKATEIIQEQCEPLKELVRLAKVAEGQGDYPTAINTYKELAKYCYSQRKAIEVNDEGEKETRTIEVRIVGNEGSQVLSTSTSSIEV